jgi:hypothetical protein
VDVSDDGHIESVLHLFQDAAEGAEEREEREWGWCGWWVRRYASKRPKCYWFGKRGCENAITSARTEQVTV